MSDSATMTKASSTTTPKPKSKPLTPHQIHTLHTTLPSNTHCAECLSQCSPDWASLTYATLLCLDCAGIHRGLGVHLSFVRSLTMDDWKEEEWKRMMRGGNGRWAEYWRIHSGGDAVADASDRDAATAGDVDRRALAQKIRLKYESDVARKYREMLDEEAASSSSSTNSDKNETSGSIVPPTKRKVAIQPLPEEPVPTIQQVYNPVFSFAFNVTFCTTKPKLLLVAWSLLGLGGAYYAHSNTNRYSLLQSSLLNGLFTTGHLLTLGILAATIGMPYLFLDRLTKRIARGQIANRQEAFKSAKNLLAEKISTGRAARLERCDVYYPALVSGEGQESNSDGDTEGEGGGEKIAKCGLIFFPGGLVDRAAYAPIATKLSDAGVLVVIANHEKYARCLLDFGGFNCREEIMRMIYDSICGLNAVGSGGSSNAGGGGGGSTGMWQVEEWAIGGHSWGGGIAIAALAKEMSSTIKKLVLWGVSQYPTDATHPGGSGSLRNVSDMKVLVLKGSNDGFTKFNPPGSAKYEEFMEKMPPRWVDGKDGGCSGSGSYIREITIQGGNHSGCAHYGPQTYPFPDGERTITLEEQQNQMANLTADFLIGVPHGGKSD